MKRIIFDLDNTLIPWSDDYFLGFIEKMIEYNVIDNEEGLIKFNEVVNSYETHNSNYDKELFINFLNKGLNKNIPIEFYYEFENYFSYCIPKEKDLNVFKILDYLKDKYELVILTNFFEDAQIKRIESYGIKHYFKEIYGADKYMKPYKESYLMACGENKPSECIMIGDNYENDYCGAINAGLKAIYLNINNKELDKDVTSVNSLIELKDIL